MMHLKQPLELWQIRNSCEEKGDLKWIEGVVIVELSEIIECPDLESFLNLIGEKLAGPVEVLLSQEYFLLASDGNTLFIKAAGDAFAMLQEEPTEKCQNCRNKYLLDELTNPIPDLEQRVAAGEPMPSGECPDLECRALCHTIKEAE